MKVQKLKNGSLFIYLPAKQVEKFNLKPGMSIPCESDDKRLVLELSEAKLPEPKEVPEPITEQPPEQNYIEQTTEEEPMQPQQDNYIETPQEQPQSIFKIFRKRH